MGELIILGASVVTAEACSNADALPQTSERALNPVLGKSVAFYATKPAADREAVA